MRSRREQMADTFRLDLLAREARLVNAIGDRYRVLLVDVDRQLRELVAAMDAATAAGQPITSSMIWRENRLERIRTEAFQALVRAGTQAVDLIEDARFEAARQALDEADALVDAAFAAGPRQVALQLSSSIPQGSVIQAISATQPATPLANLLASIAHGSVDTAITRLVNGVALGHNPRKIAAAMRQDLSVPRYRAERIARTEVMRAHRESTLERYRQYSAVDKPLVEGWTWYAQSGSCCVACLAMHGSKHTLDDRLDGHPNCRCVMLPTTVSWADLGYEGIEEDPDVLTGDQLLASMIEDGSLDRFGPGVRSALESGRAQLGDFVQQRFDPEWGTMRSQRPLRSVLETT